MQLLSSNYNRIAEVAKGLGVKHVEVVDPTDIGETANAFKRALEYKGPSVVVCKYPCILLVVRDKRKKGEKIPVYQVNQEKCRHCNVCILQFGCPAFYFDQEKNVRINEELCNGCGVCVQVCPFGAIGEVGEKR